jgi:hypothetical protein
MRPSPYLCVILVFAFAACSDEPSGRGAARYRHPMDDVLRLNHVQVEATHNSYHVKPTPAIVADWDYTHAPLDQQFEEQGVRGVELDLQWNGGDDRYEVYHVTIVDPQTTCSLFVECLATMRTWSDAHPGHHPIFVQIEPKGGFTGDDLTERFDAMDAEIRAMLPPELLVTPDDVRGEHATLAAALAADGWPTLGETRGRFFFYFDCERDVCVDYAGEGGTLAGRVLFPDSLADDPFAGFMVVNTPGPEALEMVEAGYLVRVRSESLTAVLDGEPDDLEAALATGAQVVSTDFPAPRGDEIEYFVEIPDGTPSRCNPVTAPEGCTSLDVEDPARIGAGG